MRPWMLLVRGSVVDWEITFEIDEYSDGEEPKFTWPELSEMLIPWERLA